jgi:hypothetical protein
MRRRLPVRLVLTLAAVVNLAPLALTGLLLSSGTVAGGDDAARMAFIGQHAALWSAIWVLWMAGALGFVLSIWAIERTMQRRVQDAGRDLLSLAVIAAVLGGALDLAGDAVQATALPLAAQQSDALAFALGDHLATALSAGIANMLYALAGIAVTGALARAPGFSGWITALGWLTWLVTLAATPAIFVPAVVPAAVAASLLLYAAWLGAIALWGLPSETDTPRPEHALRRV